METKRPTVYDLLQPELLTVEQLCEILHTKCISKNFSKCNKEELVEIFRRVAYPLPQRPYSTKTMRGKLLARRQSLENKKRTSTPSFKTLTHVEVSPRKSMVAGLSKQADQDTRIKPPIDSSNLKHKIIKLNSTNRRKSDDLEKVVIKDKSKECSSQKERSAPCQEETNEDRDEFNGKKHKKIKIDFSDKSEKSTPTPKVVDSKRLSSSTEVVPKKKHKRIVI